MEISRHNRKATGVFSFLRNHGSTMLRGGYRRAVLGLPYTFSFNIADRCPIGCQCYWRAQEQIPELTDEGVVAFFEKKRHEGYVFATLVGGEPYVRPELLTKVAGIIPLNWVVTSGTTPLRSLKNTTHIVSIDGASAETHDHVRRSKVLYGRILMNLGKARATGYFPTVLHTTLNAMNYREIGEILETWSTNGLADGVNISTLTPIRGAGDDGYRLSREQRIWIVNDLLIKTIQELPANDREHDPLSASGPHRQAYAGTMPHGSMD